MRKRARKNIVGYHLPINLKYQQSLREKVIEFFGGKCMNPQCLVPGGCTDTRCLQIDHKKAVMGGIRLVGIALYLDILQSPTAKDRYQLLCANCNWIKRYENKEIRNGKRIPQTIFPHATLTLGDCINPIKTSCCDCDIQGCNSRYIPKSKVLFGLREHPIT